MRAANCALTPTQIADALYMSPEAMAGGLIHFQSRGLVQPSNTLLGAYKYEPVQREIEAIVEQTAQTYANKRVAIVNLIFSRNAGSMNSSD
ncbi:MAG: hypothetical protein SGJ27_04530 [Candidatus Melainabacteria bacterium]|nr:hypothetical protein [Candidatus Melainabacteria bacterium]